jgi:osmotically-inducible protein OsmY
MRWSLVLFLGTRIALEQNESSESPSRKPRRHALALLMIMAFSLVLSGCLGGVWTGASLVYDRHNVYKKIDDYSLAVTANQVIFNDKLLKQEGCNLDLAVFNGDILLAGHVPSAKLRAIAERRLESLSDYRHLYKHIAIDDDSNTGLDDIWITTKIRTKMIADADIDPSRFKIITVDGVVYVMGDVEASQSLHVIDIARKTKGVIRVVTLLRYYNLSKKPSYERKNMRPVLKQAAVNRPKPGSG